jgi:YD repeat-containing protein
MDSNAILRKLAVSSALLILSIFSASIGAQEVCYQYRPSAGCCAPWGEWRADYESAWEEWKQRFNDSGGNSGCGWNYGRLYDIQSIVSEATSPPYEPVDVTARVTPKGRLYKIGCVVTWSRVCPPLHYVSPDPPPEAECGASCNGIGDPINPSSAALTYSQTDVEIAMPSGLEFKRFSNSASKASSALGPSWSHSHSQRIKEVSFQWRYRPRNPARDSPLYSSQGAACSSGFDQIKSEIPEWATATATPFNGVCTISRGGVYLGTLPIYFNDPRPPSKTWGTIGYDAIRDDGRTIHFSLQNGVLVAPPGVSERLRTTSAGYVLVDSNDSVETYDTNGALTSVKHRNGLLETLSYDSSGRLSTVVDSFGHKLVFTYDANGRMSSIVRE